MGGCALKLKIILIAILLGCSILTAPALAETVDASDFSSIQTAIGNVQNGDIILINSGTYEEQLTVDKEITLRGVDTGGGKPIIDARGVGNVITIQSNNVTLERLILKYSGTLGYNSGVYVPANHQDLLIAQCEILNNKIGICCLNIQNTDICDTIISSSDSYPVFFQNSYNNSLQNLTIYENNNGVVFSCCRYNSIHNSTFHHNEYYSIVLSNSNNVVTNCTITEGTYGIRFIGENNKIENNSISVSNTALSCLDSISALIANNVIKSSGYGIKLGSTSQSTITKNTIRNCNLGIKIEGSRINRIFLNNIIGNHLSASDNDDSNIWISPDPINYEYEGNSYTNHLGNFWSDYYPVTDLDDDGIGDHSYEIDSEEDTKPLIDYWQVYLGESENPDVMKSAPYARFTSNVSSGYSPLAVEFTDQSAGGLISSRKWDFGDSNTSTENNPVNIYYYDENTPDYTVNLTSSNTFGSSSNTSQVKVYPHPPDKPSISSESSSRSQGQSFVVTITGAAARTYYLYIQNKDLVEGDTYPMVLESQPLVNTTGNWDSFTSLVSDYPIVGTENATYAYANVTTRESGTRAIEWNTSATTNKTTYIITVLDPEDPDKFGTSEIRIDGSLDLGGDISITPSSDGVYSLGDVGVISGTNSASDTTYLFITGPNLPTNGANLTNANIASISNVPSTFTSVATESDNSWEYILDTSKMQIDAGTYTIYGAARPYNHSDVSATIYNAASVVIKKPFIDAKLSKNTAQTGDVVTLSGTATGSPDSLMVWGFGNASTGNVYWNGSVAVSDDTSFSYNLPADKISQEGTYWIAVQHPMYNRKLDILTKSTEGGYDYVYSTIIEQRNTGNGLLFYLSGPDALHGADASQALIEAINSPDIDDTYRKSLFYVEQERDHTEEKGGSSLSSVNFELSEISVLPSGTSIETGTSVTVNASLTFEGSGGLLFPDSHTLEAYTALENPQWTYSLLLNDHGEEQTYSGHYLDLNGWELSYFDSNSLTVNFSVLGTTPNENTLEFQVFKVEQIDSSGNVLINGVYSANRTIGEASDDTITLSPGWNFISTPRQLASGNNSFAIFSEVDTDGRQILGYNANAETWTQKQSTDTFDSMTGTWIYANESATINLNYATGAAATPPVKTVYAGWNAIGLSDSSAASASNALTTIEGVWKILIDFDGGSQSYGTSIINGATGTHAETRGMAPKRGYWLYATEKGTLAAISA